jgi:LysR family glycine cleavage system transcriptional activator
VELFRRERHGISLTQAGQRYGDAIAPAFESIGKATGDIMRSGSDRLCASRPTPRLQPSG